jgi:hypothetical protein
MKTTSKFQITLALVFFLSFEIASLGMMYANPLHSGFENDPDLVQLTLKNEVQELEIKAASIAFEIEYLKARNSFLSTFPYTHTKIEVNQNIKLLRYNQLLLGKIEQRKSKNLVLINSLGKGD